MFVTILVVSTNKDRIVAILLYPYALLRGILVIVIVNWNNTSEYNIIVCDSFYGEASNHILIVPGVHTRKGMSENMGYLTPHPQKEQKLTKFCSCANCYRMAMSTSRVPQNQSQSIKFLGVWWRAYMNLCLICNW